MVPCLVLNLDRSTDRLADITAQFLRIGIPFERIPAIDGRKPFPDHVRGFLQGKDGQFAASMQPGERGCYASHIAVWQRIASGAYGAAALVCEDDIILPDDLREVLDEIVGKAPSGWDVIRLSSHAKRAVVSVVSLRAGRHLVRYSRHPVYSGATLVSQAGARKLIRPFLRTVIIDQDLRRPWLFGLDAYGVTPQLVQQPVNASLIHAFGGRAANRLNLRDPLRRLRYGLRTLGAAQWVRCAAWNAFGRKLGPNVSMP